MVDVTNPNPSIITVPVIIGGYTLTNELKNITFEPKFTNQVVFPTVAGFYQLGGLPGQSPNSNVGPDPDYNPVGK
jgi:hypothetical protein